MIKLSILLLTHNRPQLFTRCLNAILKQIPENVEVIVNNDSSDIVEINHPAVRYYYNSYEHLSDVYKFLLNEARGEFVYYAEDDDYISDDIIEYWLQNTDYDMLVGNFFPTYSHPVENLTFWQKTRMFKENSLYYLDEELLQLSQYVFRKTLISDFKFAKNSNIHNDILLVKHAISKIPSIKTSAKIFYKQTIDGGDNLSF